MTIVIYDCVTSTNKLQHQQVLKQLLKMSNGDKVSFWRPETAGKANVINLYSFTLIAMINTEAKSIPTES